MPDQLSLLPEPDAQQQRASELDAMIERSHRLVEELQGLIDTARSLRDDLLKVP